MDPDQTAWLVAEYMGEEDWERIVEIKDLYGEPDIVSWIKKGRIRWLGHVYRMEKEEAGLNYDGWTMWRKTWSQLERSRGLFRMEETCIGGQGPLWAIATKKKKLIQPNASLIRSIFNDYSGYNNFFLEGYTLCNI